jgi:hypothetical protein
MARIERLLDGLLILTTRRASARRPALAAILRRQQGLRLRRAGPRWFAVWSADRDRLRRLRVLLLPETWLGLSPGQEAALALHQLGSGEIPAPLALQLGQARRLLRRNLSGHA